MNAGRSYHGRCECRTGMFSGKHLFHILKRGLQARIAEEAGACAVMALERVPADIRAEGVFVFLDDMFPKH